MADRPPPLVSVAIVGPSLETLCAHAPLSNNNSGKYCPDCGLPAIRGTGSLRRRRAQSSVQAELLTIFPGRPTAVGDSTPLRACTLFEKSVSSFCFKEGTIPVSVSDIQQCNICVSGVVWDEIAKVAESWDELHSSLCIAVKRLATPPEPHPRTVESPGDVPFVFTLRNEALNSGGGYKSVVCAGLRFNRHLVLPRILLISRMLQGKCRPCCRAMKLLTEAAAKKDPDEENEECNTPSAATTVFRQHVRWVRGRVPAALWVWTRHKNPQLSLWIHWKVSVCFAGVLTANTQVIQAIGALRKLKLRHEQILLSARQRLCRRFLVDAEGATPRTLALTCRKAPLADSECAARCQELSELVDSAVVVAAGEDSGAGRLTQREGNQWAVKSSETKILSTSLPMLLPVAPPSHARLLHSRTLLFSFLKHKVDDRPSTAFALEECKSQGVRLSSPIVPFESSCAWLSRESRNLVTEQLVRPGKTSDGEDVSWVMLERAFGLISPYQWHAVLTCLCLEGRVCFVSRNEYLVSSTTLAVQQIVRPFRWLHAFLPTVPASIDLEDLWNAPVPIVFGCTELPFVPAETQTPAPPLASLYSAAEIQELTSVVATIFPTPVSSLHRDLLSISSPYIAASPRKPSEFRTSRSRHASTPGSRLPSSNSSTVTSLFSPTAISRIWRSYSRSPGSPESLLDLIPRSDFAPATAFSRFLYEKLPAPQSFIENSWEGIAVAVDLDKRQCFISPTLAEMELPLAMLFQAPCRLSKAELVPFAEDSSTNTTTTVTTTTRSSSSDRRSTSAQTAAALGLLTPKHQGSPQSGRTKLQLPLSSPSSASSECTCFDRTTAFGSLTDDSRCCSCCVALEDTLEPHVFFLAQTAVLSRLLRSFADMLNGENEPQDVPCCDIDLSRSSDELSVDKSESSWDSSLMHKGNGKQAVVLFGRRTGTGKLPSFHPTNSANSDQSKTAKLVQIFLEEISGDPAEETKAEALEKRDRDISPELMQQSESLESFKKSVADGPELLSIPVIGSVMLSRDAFVPSPDATPPCHKLRTVMLPSPALTAQKPQHDKWAKSLTPNRLSAAWNHFIAANFPRFDDAPRIRTFLHGFIGTQMAAKLLESLRNKL